MSVVLTTQAGSREFRFPLFPAFGGSKGTRGTPGNRRFLKSLTHVFAFCLIFAQWAAGDCGSAVPFRNEKIPARFPVLFWPLGSEGH